MSTKKGNNVKKKLKLTGLSGATLLVLTACGTSQVTAQSTGGWERFVYFFAEAIRFLSFGGSIGVGIIVFTIVIRTVLLPLFQYQMNSTRKMQEIQPLLKELQAKYPGKDLDSRTKLSEEMRALYKEKGVKTSSAFLPLLIQMPVLMALFQALSRVEFLKVGHFLWLDLGAIDPTYILPVLAALFTFFSSWLTNKAMPERNGSATVEEAIQKGLNDLDIPRMKAHITVVAREKKGFLGLFGKKPAQVEIEPIAETTVVKANQKAVKGVPDEINAQNEPVKTVSEATVDLGRVVAAIKKVEEEGEVVSEEIKTEILKHDKEADTVLEEKGHEHILEKVKEPAIKESSESDFSNLGIEVEENYNIEEVVDDVTAYVQTVVDEMDVDATISSSHNRRTVNMQIDTNEPGRVIGYHGKVLKALQLLAQNYLYNRYSKNFYITINVNDYVEHRAEVLQSYAQKLATRALEDGQAQQTDPMSNSERKIIHRIVSKMEGVTSYSEGEEPNRYVVVDIEG